jgi:hypothetical protein
VVHDDDTRRPPRWDVGPEEEPRDFVQPKQRNEDRIEDVKRAYPDLDRLGILEELARRGHDDITEAEVNYVAERDRSRNPNR